jgi:hypothetical protein
VISVVDQCDTIPTRQLINEFDYSSADKDCHVGHDECHLQHTNRGLRRKRVARGHVLGHESQGRTQVRTEGQALVLRWHRILHITVYIPLHTHLNIFTRWP